MNIVKIYKEEETFPTFTIESENEIDSKNYVSFLGKCKEETYLNGELIYTKYHTK